MDELWCVLITFCSVDATSQVALNALLERSREVLLQFTKDEALAGECPLPRFNHIRPSSTTIIIM